MEATRCRSAHRILLALQPLNDPAHPSTPIRSASARREEAQPWEASKRASASMRPRPKRSNGNRRGEERPQRSDPVEMTEELVGGPNGTALVLRSLRSLQTQVYQCCRSRAASAPPLVSELLQLSAGLALTSSAALARDGSGPVPPVWCATQTMKRFNSCPGPGEPVFKQRGERPVSTLLSGNLDKKNRRLHPKLQGNTP